MGCLRGIGPDVPAVQAARSMRADNVQAIQRFGAALFDRLE